MQKPISRRQFLKTAGIAGGSALAAHSALAGAATSRKAYSTPAELAEGYDRQSRYDELVLLPVFKTDLRPYWFADNTQFWYRNDLRGGKKAFVRVDAIKGTRQAAFDHARLAQGLAKAGGKPVEADRLPFDTIHFVDRQTAVQFVVDNSGWQCDLATYACTPIAADSIADNQSEGERFGGADDDGGWPVIPDPFLDQSSPDKRFLVTAGEYNLAIHPQPGGPARSLTTNGTADRPYGYATFSPDSSALVAYRMNIVAHKPVYLIESSPKEWSSRGILHSHPYMQPGDPFSQYEMFAVNIATGASMPVQTDVIDTGDVPPTLNWRADNRRFLYEQPDRNHQRFRVIEVDGATGATRTIVDDRAGGKTKFINTSNIYTHYVNGASEVIYSSEMDGWRHLYLYDVDQGGLKNQITRGEWVVRSVDRVDEQARQIWFQASGRNPGEDPYLIHFYRINFDGTGLTALTEGDGTHQIEFSPDAKFLIDSYSRADLPPVHTLRRVADGSLVCPLETCDISELTEQGWRMPEPFHAKGRDGVTDIYGIVFRPSKIEPGRKYPILENIYAGPQDSFTRKSFSVQDSMQSMAELGFIVVQCDGMGTRNRSKAFHDVCWHNLKDAGFPDRIPWIKAVAQKYPYADTERVGIYGTSAGGQNSTGAVLFHPEFYKAAVSACGSHDNRIDKQWWNEQWMGYPVGPWYAESSNIEHADNLRGHLLLIVGELDTNVPPECTIRLTDRLQKAGKDYDLIVITGSDHTDGGAYGQMRRQDFFSRHLLGVETPNRNLPQPPLKPVVLFPRPVGDAVLAYDGGGGADTTITFRNMTSHVVQIQWLSGPSSAVPYGTLRPGEERVQHTYASNYWMVVSSTGEPLAVFVAEKHPGIADIQTRF